MIRQAFVKYHGTGNDFILVDNREGTFSLSGDDITGLCHRRLGIGADGLMELLSSDTHDFRMKYYNADGREGTMCGNGGRCISAFAADLGIVGREARFTAIDGEHRAHIEKTESVVWQVAVSLNDVTALEPFDEQSYVLDTGSPHFVRFVPDLEAIDVAEEGKKIRWDRHFRPEGINVNFVRRGASHLVVATYERGVEDVTLSCGTGVTAAAVAATAQAGDGEHTCNIRTAGGDLVVTFRKEKGGYRDIWLKGPARKVFEGTTIR